MKRVIEVSLCIAVALPLSGSAMGLLPGNEERAAWNAIEGRVLTALGGSCSAVKHPAERIPTTSAPGANRGDLAINKVASAGLHAIATVKFVISPEKAQGKPESTGGLLQVTAPVNGTYVLGTASAAWIDVVDENAGRFAKAKLYRWVDFCGRRMKAGVFELQAGARHWIQISASPEPVIDVFVAGPLN